MRGRRTRVAIGAGVTAGATIAAPGAAHADTFAVTNLLDDGSPGTLRTAVDDAQANPGFDRILFDSGLSGTLTLTDGEIEIYDGIEIVGPGHARVTVSAAQGSRIFDIYQPGGPPAGLVKATISGLTLTGGDAGGDGGAIRNYGADLVVMDSVITGNATDDFGGAIASKYGQLVVSSSVISGNEAGLLGGGISTKYASKVVVDDSTIAGNVAGDGGGGLLTAIADTLTITDSTFSGNSVLDGAGGAILSGASGTLLSNSTISGNSASGGGGVAAYTFDIEGSGAKLTSRNSTIAQNTATAYGGGIIAEGDTPAFSTNSIIAGNTAPEAPNVGGELDAAFTLVNDPAGGVITETTPGSNLIGVDPGLGPLAANGGPTQTHALLTGSPALDAGNGTGSNHDQRAQSRPVELPNVPNSTAPGADGSDIGAYEAQGFAEEGARCRGKAATIVAVPGVPTVGTEDGDVIVGTLGADVISGRGGGDLICAWDGDDNVSGGGGGDTIVGQRGDDTIAGNGKRDRLGGGSGKDKIKGGGGRDGLIGGPGDDELRGGTGFDRIFGKAGDDTMFGNKGPDNLRGGPGADRFNGGPGANILYLVRGDGDKLFGDNSSSRVVISGRAKRKLPPS